jgi:hypothetical protein
LATVPTIVTGTSPVNISGFSSTGVTYNQIVNQLGTYNFKVHSIDIIGDTYANLISLINTLSFQNVDANGNSKSDASFTLPSQYQIVNQVSLDYSGKDFILDSRTFLNANINPSSTVNIYIQTTQYANTDLL